jgi:class 3 adenylate cyclase
MDNPTTWDNAWDSDQDGLRFHVHTISPNHQKIGLHIGSNHAGAPSFAVTLSTGDAIELAAQLQAAAEATR